jgi:hypothetical protein
MGSDLVWSGKQDDPSLRRALAEDLGKIFKETDWMFEVWYPDRALNTRFESDDLKIRETDGNVARPSPACMESTRPRGSVWAVWLS